jgi:ATP-dependent exoDNAse (exonuclease V) alpha subunit
MGESVVCLRNDPVLGVVNGTRGVVESADRLGVTLSTTDGRHGLPETYAAAHLDYGYAVTVHKAQGATVDRAFVLACESLTREAGYVAMSRARKGTELFVPTSPHDDGLDCEDGGRDPRDPLERLATRLEQQRRVNTAR